MIVNGPDGPITFPDEMSREDIDARMRERYPAPVENPEASTKPAELGGIPNVIEEPSAKNVDISKGALQGFRDAGEYILGAPGEIDALERTAVEWLKHAGENDPNPLTKIMNRWGENYGAIADTLGGGAASDIGIPNKDDIQWTGTNITGIEPYKPSTPEGNVMQQFTTGLGLAPAGAAIGGDVAGSAFGKLAGKAKGLLPYIGAGAIGGHGGGIANWLNEQLFGAPTKSHPAVTNVLPPVR